MNRRRLIEGLGVLALAPILSRAQPTASAPAFVRNPERSAGTAGAAHRSGPRNCLCPFAVGAALPLFGPTLASEGIYARG